MGSLCCPPPHHPPRPTTLPTDPIVAKNRRTNNHHSNNNQNILLLLFLLFLVLRVVGACATFIATPLDPIMTSATTSNTTATNTSASSSSNNKSSSSQPAANSACAACKYQRRKCKPDCLLAPYFPANQQQKFLNAHRLFGVSNIVKIIRDLDPFQRNEAMSTIIYQSDMRAHDPVGGCYRYIRDLERQIDHDSTELAFVLRQLALCRAHTAQTITPGIPTLAPDLDVNPNLLLNTPTDDTENVIYDANLFPSMNQPQDQQQYYNYLCYDSGISRDPNNDPNASSNSNSVNNNVLSLQQQQHHHHHHHHPQSVVQDEDVKPLVDMFEIRQTLIGGDDEGDSRINTTNEVGHLHCSTNLELRDETNQVEHTQEHDLKGAASLFTLTNCTSSGS
ncbi:uncharacterized protein LOC135666041 isoform X1 [Musa acuminata AAA Group]|uniref:uncharacterized protein LOC135631968 n=1 Tax=Musa acuminata AAA Group TaxID=214697 RepID=UPI0031D7AC25